MATGEVFDGGDGSDTLTLGEGACLPADAQMSGTDTILESAITQARTSGNDALSGSNLRDLLEGLGGFDRSSAAQDPIPSTAALARTG